MIIRFTIFMCLLFVLTSDALASDPFALLFGDEVIDASTERTPSADDLILLRFNIRNYLVDESWSAFETSYGLCLPIQPLTDALEFPLEYTEDSISGWTTDADVPFALNFEDEPRFIKTNIGWCADSETLERLLPVKITYMSSTLTLQLDPTVFLPLDARLERLAARQELGATHNPVNPDYRLVDNPYKWLASPIVDMTLGVKSVSGQSPNTQASFDLAADLLKMSAHLRIASRQDKMFESARFTLFRESYLADQLGPLKARKFALGDVAANAQPLLGRSRSGRGVIISNQPLFLPDRFDQTILRGPLPTGWEAELYSDDILIDFVTTPDPNGDYVFEDVALHPGFNRLTIKLFGPHGETEERVVSQFVGSELCAANTLKYAMGYISPDTALFDGWLLQEQEDAPQTLNNSQQVEDPYGFLSATYGLTTRYAIRADLRGGPSTSQLGLSLIGSQFGGYGVLRIASDGRGRPAVQAQFQRRISNTTSLSLNGVDYGDLQTDLNGRGESAVARKLDMRLDHQIKLGRSLFPLQTELAWFERANGLSTIWASNRMSGQIEKARWSNTLRYTHTTEDAHQMQGELLTSRRVGRGRLRASLTYGYEGAFALKTASLAYQQKFNRESFLQTSLSYDMTSNITAIDTALSHQFSAAAVTVKSGLNSQGDWSLGLGLSLALFHDKHRRKKIRFAPPGLSRSGVMTPRLFDDQNNNGVFDLGDASVSGGQYITDNSLRAETGDADGVTLLPDLPSAKPFTSELKLSSVPDPFLYPTEMGRSMTLRRGQVLSYDVPLTTVGEAEGYLFTEKKGIKTAVSGVTLEALNSDGQIVSTSVSEYDGYFYFDKLPAVDLTVRAAPSAVETINGTHEAIDIKLSRDNPTALGLELVITHK